MPETMKAPAGRLSPERVEQIKSCQLPGNEGLRNLVKVLRLTRRTATEQLRQDISDLLQEREALLEELQVRRINRACAVALLDQWQASMDDPEHQPSIEIHHIDLVVLRTALGVLAAPERAEDQA